MARKTQHGNQGTAEGRRDDGRARRGRRRDAGDAVEDGTWLIDDMTPHELGVTGEILAASYLEERGYEVIEHGYRCSEGEADLIAYDFESDEIVLVEVKSRRGRAGEDTRPEEAVDERKRARYRRIASCYLMDRFPVMSIRFDVVSIVFHSGTRAQVTHFYSVFEWEAS